jgi:hypothetical protein
MCYDLGMKKLGLILALVAFAGCEEEPPPAPPPAPKPAAPASAPAAQAPAPVPAAPTVVTEGPRVVAVEGDVRVDGARAIVGTPVTKASLIETGDNAWVRVTLMPHSVIQVRANTKLSISSSPKKEWSVKLALGALWSFLPKGASYEVATNNAVAGVRGTTLYVGSADGEHSGVCACDGEVELQAGGKKKVVKSKHQHIGTTIQGAAAKAKLGPQKKSKTPPGHDDKEGAQLEKIRASL